MTDKKNNAGNAGNDGAFEPVPAQDSANNAVMRDVIGNKTDTHDGDSIRAFVHMMNEHIHNAGNVYPTLANDEQVQAAAGAWALGAFKEIVPALGITDDFDIHFINVSTASAVDNFELVLYAVETEIARIRFARTTNQVRVAAIPTQTMIIPANTQIQAKLASQAGGSKTADISIQYHNY